MIYTPGFMITFVQVISIAMKKNRSVIITKQGAPVALLLVVALVAACGLLSCSHGGDARGGDAHPSDRRDDESDHGPALRHPGSSRPRRAVEPVAARAERDGAP